MAKPSRLILSAILTLALAVAASGCAKNVDKIEFKKWGNSFVPPQRNTSGVDTTAQGGAAQNGVIPQNGINAMPKASLGGAYQRTFATSPHFRMVGGFHVTSGQ
jgi:hypothetical protein